MNCLVIMPFRPEFDEVFATVRDATEAASPGLKCGWLKEDLAAGKITDDIVDGLKTATFCISDLTGDNPNVMWETGFAMAIDKPTILIGQCIEKMPFDLKVHRMLQYDRQRLDLLGNTLIEAVKHTIARLQPEEINPLPAHLYWLGHDLARAIRLLMFEPANRLELERTLLGAVHHLDHIGLSVETIRQPILRALHDVLTKDALDSDKQRELTGIVAQAKNDCGDLIASYQGAFKAYPTAEDRDRFKEAASMSQAQ